MSKVAEEVAPSAEPQGRVFTFEELKDEKLTSKDNLHMLIHGKGAFASLFSPVSEDTS